MELLLRDRLAATAWQRPCQTTPTYSALSCVLRTEPSSSPDCALLNCCDKRLCIMHVFRSCQQVLHGYVAGSHMDECN